MTVTIKKTEQTAPKARPDTLSLSLALYENYRYGNLTYVKGKQYIFRREDAETLLQEQDAGRQIWQIWRPKVIRRQVEQTVMDMTGQRPPIQPLNAEPDGGTPEQTSTISRPLEIGDEGELEELGLGGTDDGEDNVIV